MSKSPGRPYWESPRTSSPIHRRIFTVTNDPSVPRTHTYNISRTSIGNASFTSASITRRELPNQEQGTKKGDLGRSAGSIFNNNNDNRCIEPSNNSSKAITANLYENQNFRNNVTRQQQHGIGRNFSERLKSQVQSTLSEPKRLQQRYITQQKKTNNNSDVAFKRSSSVRRCVSAISNRLHFTRYIDENKHSECYNKFGSTPFPDFFFCKCTCVDFNQFG